MSKTKKRMLAFARKNRRHWRARLGYFIANGVMLTLVYTTSNTSLWRKDGTVNGEHLFTQILFIIFSWVAYFLVQGSDPGYLSEEVTPDEAVEYSTEAMRADMWDDDFLNEGRDEISIAKTKFKKFKDKDDNNNNNNNNASSSSKKDEEEEKTDLEQGGEVVETSDVDMMKKEDEDRKLFEDYE